MKLLLTFILFGILVNVNGQCRLQDIKAFYYTPQNVLDSVNQGKVKIEIFNILDQTEWDVNYEYGEKGFAAGQGLGTVGTFTFNSEKNKHEIFIEDLEDNKKYDFYICDEYIGEFQDARELFKIDMDFDFQINRLYYIPFYDAISPGSIDYGYPSITLNSLETENGNSFLSMNAMYAMNSHSMLVLREKIPFSISNDLRKNGVHGVFEIDGYSDYLSGMAFFSPFIPMPTSVNQWESSYNTFSESDYFLTPSNFDSTRQAYFQVRFLHPIVNYWGDSYLDNLLIAPIGDHEEICDGESTWIYGQLETEEGIYLDTVLNSMGVLDSIVVTTLEFHPPLYVEEVSADVFETTGNWDSHSWRLCSNDSVVELGADFSPTEYGQYYVIVNDNNCADTSSCFSYGDSGIGINENQNFLVKIHPNPASSQVQIDFGEFKADRLELVDIFGRTCIIKVLEEGQSLYTIELEDLPNGMYFVNILRNDAVLLTEKIMKH